MANQTVNEERPDLHNDPATKYLDTLVVVDAIELFSGAMVQINRVTGEAEKAADAANVSVLGVNKGPRIDNTDDGEIISMSHISRGIHPMVNGDSIIVGDVGKIVYAGDDQTVFKVDPGNANIAGVIHWVNSDGVWVNFSRKSI